MIMLDEIITPVVLAAGHSKFFQILIVLVIMDVIFGVLRACREKKFNSTIGINGMIRKAGMLISLVCMVYLDAIVQFNLIGFIPEAIRSYLPSESIGIMEFFALIYVIYEVVSVLKNMALSGLPVSKIWVKLRTWLETNTEEIAVIPKEDEDEQNRD